MATVGLDGGVAGQHDAHRDVGGEVGVDEQLVAGLGALDGAGPHPRGARGR
jgi:hypothetical protein